MTETEYTHVKIPVKRDTRRRLRIRKAEKGVTYDQLITDMVEQYE